MLLMLLFNIKKLDSLMSENSMFNYLVTLADVKHPDTTWIKITTITIVAKTKIKFDFKKIEEYFTLNKVIMKPKVSTDFIGFEWGLDHCNFNNQISIAYTDCLSKKAVKLFNNGSIQVAGCSDLFDGKRVVNQLLIILNKIFDQGTSPEIKFNIAMINTNFNLNYTINLMEVVKIFGANPIFYVEFNPDEYAAVIIKFKPASDMKQVTVGIFSTGSINLTGAETLKEIVFAYSIVTRFIDSHPTIRVKPNPRKNTNQFDYICGYKVTDIIKYLKEKKVESWFTTKSNEQLVL
jgi:TATA-box binding protein (TBP) (component of TFIID and TFIIIB)